MLINSILKDAHRHSAFREMFSTTRHYPYSPPELEFLTDKASTFLLQQFRLIFKEQQKASTNSTPPITTPRTKKKARTEGVNIPFLTMGDLDRSALPAGYHTTYPPIPNACDDCHIQFAQDSDGTVLICGHGYHWHCYNQMRYKCNHCLEYFKKGIRTNVEAFVKRLNAGQNNLTTEDMEDDEGQEGLKINEREKITLALQNAMIEIKNW